MAICSDVGLYSGRMQGWCQAKAESYPAVLLLQGSKDFQVPLLPETSASGLRRSDFRQQWKLASKTNSLQLLVLMPYQCQTGTEDASFIPTLSSQHLTSHTCIKMSLLLPFVVNGSIFDNAYPLLQRKCFALLLQLKIWRTEHILACKIFRLLHHGLGLFNHQCKVSII